LKDKNGYAINHYHTKKTAFHSGILIYDWEDDEFEGDTFLNALNIMKLFKEKNAEKD
jgi:hypothetical protein